MADRRHSWRDHRQAGRVISVVVIIGVLTLPAEAFAQSVCGEEKPETREVAFDAASRDTRSGDAVVPTSCGGSPEVSCQNGNPVHRVLSLMQECVSVSGDPGSGFSASVSMKIATPQDIPFAFMGNQCTFRIDTTPGASETIQVSGPIVFSSTYTSDDPSGTTTVNRVSFDNLTVTGLEMADVSVGGPLTCPFINPGLGFFTGVIRDTILARMSEDLSSDICRECRRSFLSYVVCPPLDPRLTYTRFDQPCRIFDTRLGGGPLTDTDPRNFRVGGTTGFEAQGGTAGGCGVPSGEATAAVINFVAVNPSAAGNLRGSAYPSPVPATGSIINYQQLTPALNVANALTFPICDSDVSDCTTADITLKANGGSTQVVADVLGYFQRVPKMEVQPFTKTQQVCGGAAIGASCANLGFITVEAPVAGNVVVRANVVVSVPHVNGTTDQVFASINASPTSCQTDLDLGESGKAWIDASIPSGSFYPVITTQRTFAVSPGFHTFYLNGQSAVTRTLHNAGITAVFYPD